MPLTDAAIRNAKPGPKPKRLFDGGGLYLEVAPTGGKLWRIKFRFGGKEKRLSLGTYPIIGLAEARKRRDEIKTQLANGEDPSAVRRDAKIEAQIQGETFELIALEWHEKFSSSKTEAHAERTLNRLKRDVFPHLGKRPIKEITAPELLAVIRRIEARGTLETAHRVLQNCGQIFRYAVATGRAERDPSGDLRGAIPPARKKHHASIKDPKGVAGLLRSIDGYEGSFIVHCALRLAALTFVRPGELRRAEWSEFNFESCEWRIPGHKMKMREQHIVPLSRQAIEVLQFLQSVTGQGRYLFPSVRTSERPISENTVNAALRRLGYSKDEMTGHGFRSMASTMLNEQGWNRDAIERQLAHAERDNIRAAYNFAEHLPERRRMMQAWADYLDGLKEHGKVIPLHHADGMA